MRAQNVLYHMAAEGSTILWVGTKRQVKGVIQDAGQRTGMPVVTERWIGGSLTNFSVIRSRLRRLEELEKIEEQGSESQYSKKMLSSLRRERRKIQRNLGGIREMNGMPGAMVVVDPSREGNAVREGRKMGLVVIGILDTDCDPDSVDIVIPGNDDALKSVRLLIDLLVRGVEEGSANHRERMAVLGVAQKREDGEPLPMPGDEPRPTRGNRLPEGLSRAARGATEPASLGAETAARAAEPAADEAGA
jgi:small subunit ribosomal protein S2